MKTYLLLIFLTLGIVSISLGQRLNNNFTSGAAKTYSGESLNVFDLRDRTSTKGSSYWNEEWLDGKLYMRDSSKLEGYAIRYDLLGDVVEIRVGTDVKLLSTSRISEFYIDQKISLHKFVNPTDYYDISTPTIGFFEVLDEGKNVVLKKFEIDVLQPNYVPALDAGNLNKQVVQKKKYYWIYDGKLNIVPRSKSKIIELMDDLHPGAAAYAKKQKLNPKKEADLIELSKFCEK